MADVAYVEDRPSGQTGSSADRDFHQWAAEQGAFLRSGQFERLDHLRLAEEVEDLGRSEYNALESDLTVLLQHILKWDCQPSRRSRSWELTIREHRRRVARRLKANPSLVPRREAAIEEAFADGRDRALAETGLDDDAMTARCPYAWTEIMERVFELGRDEPADSKEASKINSSADRADD